MTGKLGREWVGACVVHGWCTGGAWVQGGGGDLGKGGEVWMVMIVRLG